MSAHFTHPPVHPGSARRLGSLLRAASANSRALTFTCRSHPITVIGTPRSTCDHTVIGTVMIRSPPEAQRLSALVLRLAADHGRATSCKQEPRGGSRRESTGCVEPADERLHCAYPCRRRAGPRGPTARGAPRPSRARSLTPGSAPQPSLSGGARRPVVEQALLRAHFTKSLRCWRGLCARLGDGLRRKGSNHERRRRQRWQEGQESHLALFDRQAAAP